MSSEPAIVNTRCLYLFCVTNRKVAISVGALWSETKFSGPKHPKMHAIHPQVLQNEFHPIPSHLPKYMPASTHISRLSKQDKPFAKSSPCRLDDRRCFQNFPILYYYVLLSLRSIHSLVLTSVFQWRDRRVFFSASYSNSAKYCLILLENVVG